MKNRLRDGLGIRRTEGPGAAPGSADGQSWRRPALGVGALLLVGAVAWIGGPASPGMPSAGHQPADEMAEALVDGWIDALGGMETYWKLRSATYTLTTEIWDPDSGRLRRTRPRYVTIARLEAGEAARIERWEGNDFIQHGFDGVQEWAVMNGETLSPGEKDYDEARYVSGDVFYWISLPFKLKDPGVLLHYDGTDEEGRHQMRVTFGEGVGDHSDTWFYVFEEGRAMPVSIGYREEGRQNISRTYWEDIQEVDGYIFTGRRVHVNAEGKIWKVLVTSDFVLNPEIDPAVFRGP